jgi:hypothetical protein
LTLHIPVWQFVPPALQPVAAKMLPLHFTWIVVVAPSMGRAPGQRVGTAFTPEDLKTFERNSAMQ